MTALDAPWYYRVVQFIIRSLLRIFTRLDVTGLENVPASGAAIVVANHLHWSDVAVLFAVVPRRLAAFSKRKWKHTVGGWVMQAFTKVIFIASGELDRQSLAEALEVLKAGGTLGVAPEGTRSRTGGLQRGYNGAVYLASRAGVPIIPVALWGQERIFSMLCCGRRAEVHMRVAEPIHLPVDARQAGSVELGTCTDDLMMIIARMLPPAYRGVYADRIAAEEQAYGEPRRFQTLPGPRVRQCIS